MNKEKGIQGKLWAHKTQQKELGQENLIVFEVSELYLPVMEAKRCYIWISSKVIWSFQRLLSVQELNN